MRVTATDAAINLAPSGSPRFRAHSNNSIIISPPPQSTLVSPLFVVTVTVTRQLSRATIVWRARADSHLPSTHRHLHDATTRHAVYFRGLIIINHVNFTITGRILPAAPFAFYAVESRREKVWQSKTFYVLTWLMSTIGIIRSVQFHVNHSWIMDVNHKLMNSQAYIL